MLVEQIASPERYLPADSVADPNVGKRQARIEKGRGLDGRRLIERRIWRAYATDCVESFDLYIAEMLPEDRRVNRRRLFRSCDFNPSS